MGTTRRKPHRIDLQEVLRDLLRHAPNVRERPMFGYPAFFAGGRMFACLSEEGVGLKLPAARVAGLLDGAGIQAFRPHGKPPMREWVHVVPQDGEPAESLRTLAIEAMDFTRAPHAPAPSRGPRR